MKKITWYKSQKWMTQDELIPFVTLHQQAQSVGDVCTDVWNQSEIETYLVRHFWPYLGSNEFEGEFPWDKFTLDKNFFEVASLLGYLWTVWIDLKHWLKCDGSWLFSQECINLPADILNKLLAIRMWFCIYNSSKVTLLDVFRNFSFVL